MSDLYFENSQELNGVLSNLPVPEVRPAHKAAFLPRAKDDVETTLATINKAPKQLLQVENQNTTVLTALQSASKEFLGDSEYMLKAIRKNHNAFEYVSKQLRQDPEFCAEAIKANPAVYAHLKLEEKLDPAFHQAYMKAMRAGALEHTVSGTQLLLPPQQLDKDYPLDVKKFGECYATMLSHAAKPELQEMENERRKRENAAFFKTTYETLAIQNPQRQHELDAEKQRRATTIEAREEFLERTKTLDKRVQQNNRYYAEMIKRNPDLEPEAEINQKLLWQTRAKQAEMLKAYKKLNNSHRVVARTEREVEEEQKAQETLKEAKKCLKTVEVEDSIASYLKAFQQDYIYSLQDAGRITDDQASLCIGLLECVSTSHLLRATANDFDNYSLSQQEIAEATVKLHQYQGQIENGLQMLYAIMPEVDAAAAQGIEREEMQEYRESQEQEKEERETRRINRIQNDPAFHSYDNGEQFITRRRH